MKFLRIFLLLIIFGLFLAMGFSFRQFFLQRSLFPRTVLFLCVHNSFRSQMAEAYFNKLATEAKLNWQAKSAGFLEAEKINEKAIILMQEEGIDISDKKPKLMTEEMLAQADKIVVVCKECESQGLCLVLPKEKDIEYWRLDDPAKMSLEKGREIRSIVKEKVLGLIKELKINQK